MKWCLFLMLISSFCFSQNKVDANGKKQGAWSKLYKGTKIAEYKGQFKDDLPVGKFTYYYASGKVKAIIMHQEGSTRSAAVYYHETGAIMSKGIYKNLKKDSIWLNYGPSGRLSVSETYVNDVLHGKRIVYIVPEDPSDFSQRISIVSFYVNGLLEGDYLEYFDNGGLYVKGKYLKNRKEGLWEIYHLNGKIRSRENYTLGSRNGWCFAFDEQGKEVAKAYFSFGERLEGKRLEEHLKLQQKKKNSNR